MSSKGRIKGWIAIAFVALAGIVASSSNALAVSGPTPLSALRHDLGRWRVRPYDVADLFRDVLHDNGE